MDDKQEKIFNQLVISGLDFLDNSIKELNDLRYKYSIIFFCSAVEILLKALLSKEHWYLIIAKDANKKPDKELHEKLENGELLTVAIDELKTKLISISKIKIDLGDFFKLFDELSKQRNKSIHFYNKMEKGEGKLDSILLNQWIAWHYLYEVLCLEQFNKHINEINKINGIIKNNKEYKNMLQHKYTVIQYRLNECKNNGWHITKCQFCSNEKETAILKECLYDENGDFLFYIDYHECLICDKVKYVHFQEVKIKCKCSSCDEVNDIIAGKENFCGKCNTLLNPKLEETTDWEHNCICGSKNIIFHEEKSVYFCASCYSVNDYIVCEYCNQIVNIEDVPDSSYNYPDDADCTLDKNNIAYLDTDLLGCGHCYGYSDYQMNKND